MSQLHFFGSVDINNFEFPRGCSLNVIMSHFNDMYQPPINPLTIDILNKEISHWRLLINTNPSFSFEINTCKDQECSEKSKVFVKDEDIYFDYDSGVEAPLIIATLTYPDKTAGQINLPSCFIRIS